MKKIINAPSVGRRKDGCCEMLIWNVPTQLKNKVKAKSILQGKTIQETIIALMEGYVND